METYANILLAIVGTAVTSIIVICCIALAGALLETMRGH